MQHSSRIHCVEAVTVNLCHALFFPYNLSRLTVTALHSECLSNVAFKRAKTGISDRTVDSAYASLRLQRLATSPSWLLLSESCLYTSQHPIHALPVRMRSTVKRSSTIDPTDQEEE